MAGDLRPLLRPLPLGEGGGEGEISPCKRLPENQLPSVDATGSNLSTPRRIEQCPRKSAHASACVQKNGRPSSSPNWKRGRQTHPHRRLVLVRVAPHRCLQQLIPGRPVLFPCAWPLAHRRLNGRYPETTWPAGRGRQQRTQFKPGDEVFGDLFGCGKGAYASMYASRKRLAPKPANLSFEEAAAVPEAALRPCSDCAIKADPAGTKGADLAPRAASAPCRADGRHYGPK